MLLMAFVKNIKLTDGYASVFRATAYCSVAEKVGGIFSPP